NTRFSRDWSSDVCSSDLGNEDLTFYNVDASITRKGFESLSAVGEINAGGANPSIDLEVSLQNVNLAAFSPLGGEAIDNIRGYASDRKSVVKGKTIVCERS